MYLLEIRHSDQSSWYPVEYTVTTDRDEIRETWRDYRRQNPDTQCRIAYYRRVAAGVPKRGVPNVKQ